MQRTNMIRYKPADLLLRGEHGAREIIFPDDRCWFTNDIVELLDYYLISTFGLL